jgi:hypothetical protein
MLLGMIITTNANTVVLLPNANTIPLRFSIQGQYQDGAYSAHRIKNTSSSVAVNDNGSTCNLEIGVFGCNQGGSIVADRTLGYHRTLYMGSSVLVPNNVYGNEQYVRIRAWMLSSGTHWIDVMWAPDI